MKGVINKGFQELVEAKLGAEAWERVRRAADCNESFFAIGEEYPDELTTSLARAAASEAGRPLDEILREFGRYWVLNTGRKYYPTFYILTGGSPRDYLVNMGRIFQKATLSPEGAVSAELEYESDADGRLRIHFRSPQGLCSVLKGMIEGVGSLYDETLQVRETACMSQGDPCCTMEVTF